MGLFTAIASFPEEDIADAPRAEAHLRHILSNCDEVSIGPLEEHEGYYEHGIWIECRWFCYVGSGWIWSLN